MQKKKRKLKKKKLKKIPRTKEIKNTNKENIINTANEINGVGKKKKSKKIKKIVGLITLVILLGIASAVALTSPYFNISKIEILENETIDDNTYIKLSELKKNENIFKFKKSQITSNIKRNSYVEDVQIKRILPNKVQITINERKIRFLINKSEEYAYIDEKGDILEISNEKKNLPILIGVSTENKNLKEGRKLNEVDIDRIQDIIKIQNSIKNNEIQEFDSIDVSNKFDYILSFEKDVKKVHLGDINDLETKILYMKYILNEQEGVPGTIYLNQSKVYFSPD